MPGRPRSWAFPRLLWTCVRGGAVPIPPSRCYITKAFTTSAPRHSEVKEGVNKEWEAGSRASEGEGHNPSTDLELQSLVTSLSAQQQTVLLTELHRVQGENARMKAEEKLASWRWRSQFGRPTSLHCPQSPQPDPTGTFCTIPEEWLQKKAAEKSNKLSALQLRQLAVHNALPFIGFGFLDNLIMIIAGDYIDITIGTGLGISTMAAAALGNTISDLAGIGSAWYVENVAVKIGIMPPELSPEQLESMGARWSANLGRGFGVVLGCLLGMFPLFFLPNHVDDKKLKDGDKKLKEEDNVLQVDDKQIQVEV
ncbi:Transmembrane protein 65 [Chionoecetes opilio]|uniref:Transmembrane protein 65 n=1 Tax=Chionoecetes opilio TaxID=41210 RepID=A0A8J4YJS9_CHIOP|nr:Transmembrane protein 65 [Chionoecetes opilio]